MKRLVAGVDIDRVATTLALVDEFGKIYAKSSFPTSDHKEFKNYVARLKDEIDILSEGLHIPHTIEAVGVGAPNSNYYTGDIENAANLIWKGRLPLGRQLSTLFDNKPVVVTNDANAAAIGEMTYGGAKGMKHFVVITENAFLLFHNEIIIIHSKYSYYSKYCLIYHLQCQLKCQFDVE